LSVGLALVVTACTDAPRNERRSDGGTPETTEQAIEVPDVQGLTTTEADRVLIGVGLLLQVTTEGGDDALVLSQSPQPGTVVDPGTTVTVRARCYPAPCPSPVEGTIYDPCTCASR
jgi:hypothetical protein